MKKPFSIRPKKEILMEYIMAIDRKERAKADWTDEELFRYGVLELLADIRRQLGKTITEIKRRQII